MARITCLSIPITKTNFILLLLAILSCVGCSAEIISPTPTLCNIYNVDSMHQADCINVNGNTLVQTALDAQLQIDVNETQFTVAGTSYLAEVDDKIFISVLEGTAVIASSQGVSSVQIGQQITVDVQGNISQPEYYDITVLSTLPLKSLKRNIDLILPTATPVRTATPVVDCPPPENWTDDYIVRSGESLTSIAEQANVSVEDLQSANCIDNPNNIQIGLALRVPKNAIQPTAPSQTNTPSAVLFRVDKTTIQEGDCTTLRWDVQNIRQLRLDGEDVTNQTSRQICPSESTSYQLVVNYFDDREIAYEVRVEVDKS